MKRTILGLALVAALLSGCQSETEYGECIGITAQEDPTLAYKLSVRNVVIGGIFFQTIFVPVIVAATETFCPVGHATPAAR